MKRNKETDDLIELAGGQSKVADELNIKRQSVFKWKTIPVGQMPALRRLITRRHKRFTKLYDKYNK